LGGIVGIAWPQHCVQSFRTLIQCHAADILTTVLIPRTGIVVHASRDVTAPYHYVSYLGQFYHSDVTFGTTHHAIGDVARAAKYSPETHRILSWHSSTDGIAFARAIFGDSALVSFVRHTSWQQLLDRLRNAITNAKSFQTAKVDRLIKRCTNFWSVACGFAYRSRFPEAVKLKMHFSDNDTLDFFRMYELLFAESSSWVHGL
jgi:hypothetical protein